MGNYKCKLVIFTMANGQTEKKTDLENIFLLTKISMRVNSVKVREVVKENMYGRIIVFMMVSGKEIK